MRAASSRGAALADILMTTAFAALVSATTLPVVAGAIEHERARLGAERLSAALHAAQLDALRRGRFVALRFELEAGDSRMQAFADGNGNGVRTIDITNGVDVPLGPASRLGLHVGDVALRINQLVPDIGGAGWLESGADPLRIGRTNLLSFSPLGTVTAGTLYVSAPRGTQFAVRLTGPTGRIRVLRYDRGAGWRP